PVLPPDDSHHPQKGAISVGQFIKLGICSVLAFVPMVGCTQQSTEESQLSEDEAAVGEAADDLEEAKETLAEEKQDLAEARQDVQEETRSVEEAEDDVGDARRQLQKEQEEDRKSTRLNSSHVKISYAVFCLKKKKKKTK